MIRLDARQEAKGTSNPGRDSSTNPRKAECGRAHPARLPLAHSDPVANVGRDDAQYAFAVRRQTVAQVGQGAIRSEPIGHLCEMTRGRACRPLESGQVKTNCNELSAFCVILNVVTSRKCLPDS